VLRPAAGIDCVSVLALTVADGQVLAGMEGPTRRSYSAFVAGPARSVRRTARGIRARRFAACGLWAASTGPPRKSKHSATRGLPVDFAPLHAGRELLYAPGGRAPCGRAAADGRDPAALDATVFKSSPARTSSAPPTPSARSTFCATPSANTPRCGKQVDLLSGATAPRTRTHPTSDADPLARMRCWHLHQLRQLLGWSARAAGPARRSRVPFA